MVYYLKVKAILKSLNHRKSLVFLDLEGTQFSHELIALGAIKAKIDEKGQIIRSYKGIKIYVKSKNNIGKLVINLTGITQDKINQEGISYAEALQKLKNYLGPQFKKTAFMTFGNHDLRILNQSLNYSQDADKEILSVIMKNHIDFSAFISQFIRDEKNNPYSLANYLQVFNLPFVGQAHDPLNDARALLDIYAAFLSRKDIVFQEYLKILANHKSFPPFVAKTIQKLINHEDVDSATFLKMVEEYLD